MDITIRYATAQDAAFIADISRQTFYETFADQNSKEDMDKFLTDQFTRPALMAEVGAPGNIFLLAYSGTTVGGYARLREGAAPGEIKDMPAMEIARLYAVKEMIGKGVGKAMMEKCIAVAKENNKQLLWLGVWEKNEKAIQFYKSWGFQKFGEHDFIVGHDVQVDWLMMKAL